jgi:DUF917 family protein
MRELTADDIDALAIGAGILGTGGGGNPYIGKLRCRQELKKGRPIRLIGLDELDDEAVVISVGGIGAPVVGIEKFEQGEECLRALRAVEETCGCKASALIAAEIGGGNSMEPLLTAAQAGLVVVDGDGMGRAFPEMQMTTFSIYGGRTTPAALADERGAVVVYRSTPSDLDFERLARATAVAMGGTAGSATAPMSGAYVKRTAVPRTVTRAIDLGYAVLDAGRRHENPIDLICGLEGGVRLMDAKIVDLKRHLRGGFAVGEIRLQGLGAQAGEQAVVGIQNEFLTFEQDGEIRVCVPDLIVVLDLDTGHPITTEVLRFGQRVAVLGLPCHDLLRTEAAMAVVGPRAFGLAGAVYRPLGSSMRLPAE